MRHRLHRRNSTGRFISVVIIAALLVSISPLLLGVKKADAAASFVNSAYTNTTAGNGNNPSLTLNFGFTATAGNLLVLVCSVGGSVTGLSTPAGYSVAAPVATGAVSQGVFYKTAGNNDTSATCGVTGRARGMTLVAQIYEYSGVEANALDVSGTSSGTTAAVSSGAATPTTANSLIFTTITALAGSSYSSSTSGYTKRVDTSAGLHIGQADMIGSISMASHSFSATNSTASAWRGHIVIFKLPLPVAGSLNVGIVDASNLPIGSPQAAFQSTTVGFVCASTTASLLTSSQKLQVTNTTSSPAWRVSVAPTTGNLAMWSSAGGSYDFNDPTGDGCDDGGDSDAMAGQLTVDTAAASVVSSAECTTNDVSIGATTAFSQGAVDSIQLLAAGATASTNCVWYLTGVNLQQKIPAGQPAGNYSLDLTLTILAI